MTYDPCHYDIPPYHQGNRADFEFELDENFPMDEVDDITFNLKTRNGVIGMPEKSLKTGTITETNRIVKIDFTAEDMNIPGDYLYEIDFLNQQAEPFANILGNFTIKKEVR